MGSDKTVRNAGKMVTATDITLEASRLVKQASLPLAPDEHIQERIRRSARRLGLSFSQAKRFWYRERQDISAHEFLNLEIGVAKLQHREATRQGLLNEMDRRVGRAFPQDYGAPAGPLDKLARDEGYRSG